MSIKLKNISKSFGKKVVIRNMSLTVSDGERVAIVAYSGSGKTTLFRIISGLEKSFSGVKRVNGSIALMFQEDRLFPYATALENVIEVSNRPVSEAEELLAELGLSDSLHLLPSDLSGGMKRRVALARALHFNGDNVLLDECFTGLDPETKQTVADVINSRTQNKTLILITHDKEEAELLGCRVIEFKNGFIN